MTTIEFHKHPRRLERWGLFRVSIWTSVDRRYAIERSKYIGQEGHLPTLFRALLLDHGRASEVISRNRTRGAAERAIVQHIRKAR